MKEITGKDFIIREKTDLVIRDNHTGITQWESKSSIVVSAGSLPPAVRPDQKPLIPVSEYEKNRLSLPGSSAWERKAEPLRDPSLE